MSNSWYLVLSEELRRQVNQAAADAGQTPEEWVAAAVRQRLGHKDARFRRHFGSVNMGRAVGTNNEQIDADLAGDYGDTHERP